MIWHLIAAIFAGLGAAGIAMLLRMASGKRLPTWIIPVFGALGMLGYQISVEYSWYEHKQQLLPESAQVVEVEHDAMFWRPWTYFFPMATAFSVIDEQSMAIQKQNGERRVEFLLYYFEKQVQDRVTTQTWLMNCTNREMLPLEADTRRPLLEHSRRLNEDAPIFQAVCQDA